MAAHEDRMLGLELIELASALEAVRILADVERDGGFASPDETRQACRATSATVGLIVGRLRQLGDTLASDRARSTPGRRRGGG
jgi:hypothetical protein